MADGRERHFLDGFIDVPRTWPEAVKSAVLVAAGLVHTAVVQVWGVTESSPQVTTRLSTEAERAKHRVAELEALVRILQGRLEAVPPQKRPDYAPAVRLQILAYRAAYGLTLAEVARRVQVTTQTIRNWMAAARDPGWGLIALPTPSNRLPDWTAATIQHLQKLFPHVGARKVAQLCARAGLAIAATTVRRARKRELPKEPEPPAAEPPEEQAASVAAPKPERRKKCGRRVTARAAHDVWHIDLTHIPRCGQWLPWSPETPPPYGPFAAWMVAVVDHFSRDVVAWKLFRSLPSAAEVVATLEAARVAAGRAARYVVSDQGSQFQVAYLAWCEEHGVRPRFGAVGQHRSIALIERWWRSLTQEFLRVLDRRWQFPFTFAELEEAIGVYVQWYSEHRLHETLRGKTPAEVRAGGRSALDQPLYEVRTRHPLPRGRPKGRAVRRAPKGVGLRVVDFGERGCLPVVELRRAA